jgi:hypothetical protein
MQLWICMATAVVLSCSARNTFAQDDSAVNHVTDFPNKLFGRLSSKMQRLNRQLEKQTEQYLLRLERQEAKLKETLYKQDSAKAKALFTHDPQVQYDRYLQKMKSDSGVASQSMGPQYLPYVDSLNASLAFVNKNPQLMNLSPAVSAEVQQSLAQFRQLQTRMQNCDQIRQFIQSREQQITQYFSGQNNLPAGASGALTDYKRQLYYYNAQVTYYRDVLNDPDKMLKTALSVLNKIPDFQGFIKSNSFLSGIFGVPGNYGSGEGLVGMQTRDQINSLIQNQVASGGPNAASALQGSLQSASQDISNVQNKLTKLGPGGGTMEYPDFKPNNQRTKPFLKRLEYNFILQTQPSSYFFPATIDAGLSVGYKLNDRATIGIGASYKAGCGKDIQHIQLSSQGAGLKSYFEIRMKKTFYAAGGFEYNFQPIDPSYKINNFNNWTQSGLVGISKVVSMRNRFFKATKLQLFWDFLSYSQLPKQQPFKFRVGYSF